MKIGYDIQIIRELLKLSQQELAERINVTFELINRWENNIVEPEDKNISLIYSFAYNQRINLNLIHEQMMKDEYNKNNQIVLFHGSKGKITSEINFSYSKSQNDFGKGFYLVETFEQAASYIAYTKSNYIYSYVLKKDNLRFNKFDVSLEWLLAIAYYRGWIDKYKKSKIIQRIIKKVEESDVVIAPIADNRMFDLIDEFVSGMTTDLQCQRALLITNLGFQYVVRTPKALNNLSLLNEMFLCNIERKNYVQRRLEQYKVSLDKVKIARIEYKNKGNYIEEIMNEKA